MYVVAIARAYDVLEVKVLHVLVIALLVVRLQPQCACAQWKSLLFWFQRVNLCFFHALNNLCALIINSSFAKATELMRDMILQ